jgi:hypothetical protein
VVINMSQTGNDIITESDLENEQITIKITDLILSIFTKQVAVKIFMIVFVLSVALSLIFAIIAAVNGEYWLSAGIVVAMIIVSASLVIVYKIWDRFTTR